jgi:type IV pilus assembly protein PilA
MRKGFSLIELMIVVAIIGILAAIAIPNFVAMQLKAKRGEIPSNVDGIKTAQMAYDAAFDGYVSCETAPREDSSLNKSLVDWTTNTGFTDIGWKPDGQVRGNYAVAAASSSTSAADMTVTGHSDVDADGTTAEYTATANINSTLNTSKDAY